MVVKLGWKGKTLEIDLMSEDGSEPPQKCWQAAAKSK